MAGSRSSWVAGKRTCRKGATRAAGGGCSGALAMLLQVVFMMWLRTTVNYQYRHGGSVGNAFATLYAEGGVTRFYQGLGPALVQGALARFGDAGANEGTQAMFTGMFQPAVVTFTGSLAAAGWRMAITPIDTVKTIMQVDGEPGLERLKERVAEHGMGILYNGAFGTAVVAVVSHFPWFYTNNFLERRWPPTRGRRAVLRNAGIGFASGVATAIVSNGARVLKTLKQTSPNDLSYWQAAELVISQEGVLGLMLRGLGLKIVSNGVQSLAFNVLWRYISPKKVAMTRPVTSPQFV